MSFKQAPSKDLFDISWITKDTRCWIYQANANESDLYIKGIVKGIVPLSINKANSRVTGLAENGASFEVKAHQLERCRDSNSIERDLIEMDIINAPEVLMQLKRRLADHKIHTCLWNSLIIVNPFKLIPEQYSEKCLASYFDSIFIKGEDIRRHEPHIFSFMFQILAGIQHSNKTQVISISGESGSGKTEANKHALRAISYCSSRVLNMRQEKSSNMENQIISCDPILEVFGNSKTIKNDNSSRFGKLISLKVNGETMKIHHTSIKNYFLEKSRIISQSAGERNFHIFYQFLQFISDDQRALYRMKSPTGTPYRQEDFHYLTEKVNNKNHGINDRQMWDDLNQALVSLEFKKEIVHEIWSIVAAVLLIGNLAFEAAHSENEPCEIKNPQVADSIAHLLGLERKEFNEALVTHRRTIAGELVLGALSERQCREGRDSMGKAVYESMFQWLIEELNRRLSVGEGGGEQVRQVKLLDIYGFEVFEWNSFEQLCVNYTNECIHQIYLEQVFIHEKNTMKREGLEHVIAKLNFTDNIKIIELLDTLNKSIFNLLDESCALNVRDDDFLANVRKMHDQHDHFPPSNNVNLRKSFIIKHTPGEIEYIAEGFREKNKDLIREDIVHKISKSKTHILSSAFKERLETLKSESNKRFLGVKIRRQVKELILEMSTNTDLHFIRCIKPNEYKKPFLFIDLVCYNQIKYLGILDTIQLRRQSYHIRKHYGSFYLKYGILENKISNLIVITQGKVPPENCKDICMRFMTNSLVNYSLDYQFGKERIFLKMSTQNVLDNLLKKRTKYIDLAATLIKAHYRRSMMARRRLELKACTKLVQKSIRSFLLVARKLRKKKAVRIIENAWIKYHQVFFARKKRPALMVLQKYFRTSHDSIHQWKKIEAVRRCKFLLKSLAAGNILRRKIETYQLVKQHLLSGIYDSIWEKMRRHYSLNLIKYLQGRSIVQKNSKQIKAASLNSEYRLNMKYRKHLETYLNGFNSYSRYFKKITSVVKIQSFFRMFKLRHHFNSLRKTVIKIQRNWRKYYENKQFSLRYTEEYFNQPQQEWGIRNERQYWNSLLYRDLGKSSKSKERGVEKILYQNDKIKQDKIGLFYYLLDFQILTPLTSIYPHYSWVDNYLTLYEQAWQKGNAIQMVQVSDEHTVCSTINKLYSWGDYGLDDLMTEAERLGKSVTSRSEEFKVVKALSVPQGRLEKIHAHNKFTVVQIENEQPFVIGNQHLYSEDSSSKEWKTLNQSFVIINGIVLTLKKIEFSRVPLTEKIVQLSCGMEHCISKTSLKKLYAWGNNSNGQLGIGSFRRAKKPRLIQFFRNAFVIQQISASAYGSVALDSNGRLFWWGSNGTISLVNMPREVMLFQKSEFIDNPNKYSVIRILPSWSRSLSLVGLTISAHDGIFKTSQNNIKKKTFQNLMGKWNEDISTITPPYIQSICGYFQEKLMPKSKQAKEGRNRQLENLRIREKLMAEIMVMEEAERNLLKENRKF